MTFSLTRLGRVSLFVLGGLLVTGTISLVGGQSATVTSTFVPVADSFVTSAKPSTNFGSNSRLRAEASPVQRSYLRFNVQGVVGTVSSATLRVFTQRSSSIGYEVRGTPNTTWGEATITYNNAPAPGSVAARSGSFGSGVMTSVDVTPLVGGNGLVSFVLTTTDSSQLTFTSREGGANAPQLVIDAVDNTPPAVTLTSPANGASTADTTPTFSGVGGTAAGDTATVTVKVYAGATASGTPVRTLNAAVGAGGAYSVDTSPVLDPGTYTGRAEQQDAGGNTGFSSPSTFSVLDAVAPAISLSSPANGSTTADTTPLFSGVGGTAAGDNATVTVRVFAGVSASGTPLQTLTASVGAGGAYSVEASPALVQGQYTARASQADNSGNTGTSTANTFVVDTDAPAPTLSSPTNGSSTTDTTPTFSGAGGTAPGDAATVTVKVYAGATASGSTVRTLNAAVSDGLYSVDAAAPLDPGTYTAQAQQQDAGGNTGFSTATTFTVLDSVAPSVGLNSPANGSATSDTTPLFSGVGGTAPGDDPTVTVRVYAGTSASGPPLQTLTASVGAGGAYSVEAPSPLAHDQYTAQARQADATGNVGLSSANTFTVSPDATPPAVTLTNPANGTTTTDATPTFSGVAGTAAGDSSSVAVNVYSGTGTSGTPVQTRTTTAGAGGAYSVDASPALTGGVYTARAEQQDTAGNTGFSSATTFTISDPVFVGAGDIADCGDGTVNTAAIINGMPNATAYTVGDNSYPNGTPSDYASCYEPTWGAFRDRTRPTIGDHDYGDGSNPSATGYFGFFQQQLAPFGAAAVDPKRGWYSYNLGAWHIVHLNAQCYDYAAGCDPPTQEAWLRADLAADTSLCNLVIWHEPRWSSGSVHGNTPTMQSFWAAAYDYGADVVLSGSDHIYERFAPMDSQGALDTQHGVRQFTVGTGGAGHYAIGTIKPNSEVRNVDAFGVLKLTLHASSYDWQFVPEAGRTFTDSGTKACHGPPPPPPDAVPDVRSASSNAGNAIPSITIDKPVGTVPGDLLVAVVSHQSGSNRTMTAPAGWTRPPNTDVYEGTNAHMHTWYKLAGVAEPASYTFILSGSATDGRDTAGGIIAISGANQTTPIDASGSQSNGATSSTSVLAPSITTTVPNTLLLFAGSGASMATYNAPPGMTELFDRTTSGTYKVSIEAASQALTNVGPSGTRAALASTSVRSVGAMIAVRPL